MTAFTPDDLRQIADLADHMDFTAPIPMPKGGDNRLPIEVLILDGVGEAAVRLQIPNSGDTIITFPPTPEPTTGKTAR